MDLHDLSRGSSEDEDTKDNSSATEKSILDDSGNHFPLGIEKNSNKNGQNQEKMEVEDSVSVARTSTRKAEEDESPICAKRMKLSWKVPPVIGTENLKSSQSRLSIASTDATYGSSSSSDDEPLDDLEEINKLHEPENASDSAHVISRLPAANFENMPASDSVTSSTGHIELVNVSQTSKCVLTGVDRTSSLPEHSYLKTHQCHPDNLTSTAKSSYNSETDEMPFTKTLVFDKSSQTEASSSMNPTIEFPMPRKLAFNYTRENELRENESTGDLENPDFHGQKDKSVRRKIKEKTAVPSDTNFPPNELPSTSVSDVLRRIGHSLLEMTKIVEKTSSTDDDRDSYKTNTFFVEKNKSVRRKIKEKNPVHSDTNFPSTELPSTSVSDAFRRIGHSLLEMSKTFEKLSNTDDDRDLYETDIDFFGQKDKSVRRKIKEKTPVSSDTNLPPTERPSTSVSDSFRRIGHSLLEMSKTFEKLSNTDDDRDSYKTDTFFGQKDKSVRRKIKEKTPVSSDTNLPPTERPSTSVSDASRRIGNSLLEMTKTVEKTSNTNDDWDFCEIDNSEYEAESVASKTLMKEILTFCYQTEKANISPRLEVESLLKEVHRFFERNHVGADSSLSWKERKLRILTSPYFSDEFVREHGLLSIEELMKKYLKDLDYYTTSYLKNLRRLQELCKTLIRYNISEKNLIDYLEDSAAIPPSSSSGRSDQGSSLNDDIRRQLLCIAEEIGWDIIIDLYKKVTTNGASFIDILIGSEKSAASCAEEISHLRESQPSLNQDPSQVSSHQGTGCTLLQNKSDSLDSSRHDESIGESSRVQSRELPFQNPLLTHAMARKESTDENTSPSENETSEKSIEVNEENAGNDESNVSAKNFESKAGKTVDEE